MKEKFVPNHLHLLIKGHFNSPPITEDILNSFFIDLIKKVKMRILTNPVSIRVDDEPGNEGITGTVTLSTSHSSMHIWDKEIPSMFQFDLYSCCEFTPLEVIEILDDYFSLKDYHYWFIDRNGDKFKTIFVSTS